MDKSTPRPWHISEAVTDYSEVVRGPKDEYVLRVGQNLAEKHDNAALIVKAVNSHDELVGALTGLLKCRSVDILEESAREYPYGKEDVADIVAAFDRARAALALAKET